MLTAFVYSRFYNREIKDLLINYYVILSEIWTFFHLISPCDIVTINELTLITLVLKVSKYIIVCIAGRPISLTAILVIMSVSTIKTVVILYAKLNFNQCYATD